MRSRLRPLPEVLRWDVTPGDEMITMVARLLLMGVIGGFLAGGALGATLAGTTDWALGAFMVGAWVGTFVGLVALAIDAVLVFLMVRFARRLIPAAVVGFPVVSAIVASVSFIGPTNMLQTAGLISVLVTTSVSVLIATRTVSWCIRPIRALLKQA
jgi:hypothetical protein